MADHLHDAGDESGQGQAAALQAGRPWLYRSSPVMHGIALASEHPSYLD